MLESGYELLYLLRTACSFSAQGSSNAATAQVRLYLEDHTLSHDYVDLGERSQTCAGLGSPLGN